MGRLEVGKEASGVGSQGDAEGLGCPSSSWGLGWVKAAVEPHLQGHLGEGMQVVTQVAGEGSQSSWQKMHSVSKCILAEGQRGGSAS